MSISASTWPSTRLDEAVTTFVECWSAAVRPSDGARDVEQAARLQGLEAEAVNVNFGEVAHALDKLAPVLVKLHEGGLLALVARKGGHFIAIGPDHKKRRVHRKELRDALCEHVEASLAPETEALLADIQVSKGRRRAVGAALLKERLAGVRLDIGWIVRPGIDSFAREQVRKLRVPRKFAGVFLVHITQYAFGIATWAIFGAKVLDGRLEKAWSLGWALAICAQVLLVPILLTYARFAAIDACIVLKQEILARTLRLPLDSVRSAGVGQLLGKVLEAGEFESLAVNGLFYGLASINELIVAGLILALGGQGAFHLTLLAITVACMIGLGVRYHRQRSRWTDERVLLTGDLIESMVGRRTRLVQQRPEFWHKGEDGGLRRYLAAGSDMDTNMAKLIALAPQTWMLIAIVATGVVFVAGSANRTWLPVTLGGIILASASLRKLSGAIVSISAAGIAWRTLAFLFGKASTDFESAGDAPVSVERELVGANDRALDVPVVDARGIDFRYRDRGEPVLCNLDLRIQTGDRLLLEGSSGSGKSTLTAILAGHREIQSGLLYLHGWDKKSLGLHEWRRRVVTVPQFHENHIFTGTLAFNLLMGRAWPPKDEDLAVARSVCEELGLAPLIERMPGGMYQMVGETGWQLSHGEMSRVFLARALLQTADLVLLDESFAALDPHTLQRSLECALARTRTLVVIAHP